MTNGNTLNKIDTLLEGDDIDEKAALRLILSFIQEYLTDDHKKVGQMWPFYRGSIWVAGALALSLVGLVWAIITHQITIIWP